MLVVDARGAVVEATVREGMSPFAEAALAVVRLWIFYPAERDGRPVAARITAVVTFRAPAQILPPPPPSIAPDPETSPKTDSPVEAEPAAPVMEVAVKGEHEELGTVHIPRAEARFVPGAFGDPFRVIEALPGLHPWLSGLPYFYVRGMSPENIGYYVDGIKVPILFHVGSGPSTLAPSIVDTVDLFPAAYPARYGRYAGAIVAGETTAPDEQEAHGDFQVRVFDAAAFAETPLNDGRDTALAAGRYGYTGLITSLIDPDYKLAYWDYQARVSHRFESGDRLSLFVFGSYDQLDHLGSPTFRVQYHRADLRYDHPLHDGTLRVAATASYDDTLTALQTPTGSGDSAALQGPGGRVRAEVERHLAPEAWVRAGADLGATHFTVDRFRTNVYAPHTDVVGGFYGDVVWRPTARLEVVPGAHLDAYDVRDAATLVPQPRLSVKVKIVPGVAWISAVGIAHQEPTDVVFVPAKLPEPIDELSRQSYQYSEAFDLRLPARLELRATGFATILEASATGDRERSIGAELLLRRAFTERLAGFISYTLARTEEELPSGRIVRAPGDRTHLLSVVLGYDLGGGWRVGGRFFFESGAPYSCQASGCSPGGGASGYVVAGELPPFYRLDVRVEKRWFFAGGRWLAGTLECFNALDKAEASGATYSSQQGLGYNYQSPIILPTVGVEGGF
jgi:hypothetical protein